MRRSLPEIAFWSLLAAAPIGVLLGSLALNNPRSGWQDDDVAPIGPPAAAAGCSPPRVTVRSGPGDTPEDAGWTSLVYGTGMPYEEIRAAHLIATRAQARGELVLATGLPRRARGGLTLSRRHGDVLIRQSCTRASEDAVGQFLARTATSPSPRPYG